MYCSHLLDAASVLNCRWLYYTQEDANGMYVPSLGSRLCELDLGKFMRIPDFL